MDAKFLFACAAMSEASGTDTMEDRKRKAPQGRGSERTSVIEGK